jgi:hypothetical protein
MNGKRTPPAGFLLLGREQAWVRSWGRIRNDAGDKGEIETSRVGVGILDVIGIILRIRSPASGRVVANKRESRIAQWVCQSKKKSSSFPQVADHHQIAHGVAPRASVGPTHRILLAA